MDDNVLNLLTVTELFMISVGLVMLLKPLEVWMLVKTFVIIDPYISQSTVLTLGKIFILMGAIVLLTDLFLKFFNDNNYDLKKSS